MNCPYCNKEMEHGVIQSPQEISWNRKKHIIARAEFYEVGHDLNEIKKRAILEEVCIIESYVCDAIYLN